MLKDIKVMKIYFFGNEEQKQELLIKFVTPYVRSHFKSNYYITRGWNGGPHIEVKYEGIFTENDKELLQNNLMDYIKTNFKELDNNTIKKNIEKYMQTNKVISEIELKKFENIYVDKNATVEIRELDIEYIKSIYNSSRQAMLHEESKMMLQPIVEKVLERFENNDEKIMFLLKMYENILKMYDKGEEYAAIMFYSHIAGMFAISKQYKKYEIINDNYDKYYKKLNIDKMDKLFNNDETLNNSDVIWKNIFNNASKLFDENGFQEEGYLSLKDQGERMKKNALNIGSEFHEKLISEENVDTLITSKDHMVFRSIANILYSILISMNVTFIEKHFLCYGICRYIFKNHNVTWEQLLNERRLEGAS